jgi:hypothetical protein
MKDAAVLSLSQKALPIRLNSHPEPRHVDDKEPRHAPGLSYRLR